MGKIILIVLTVAALFIMSLFCTGEPIKESEAQKENETEQGAETCRERAEVTRIVLKDGGKSEIYGEGAEASFFGVSINGTGKYRISGTLRDGQICAEAEEGMELILDGVKVSSSRGAALTLTGKNATLTLAAGSENRLSDAYEYKEGEYAQGCVSAERSLVIGGSGTLSVSGNFADGIVCGGELRIESGNLNVSAARNALKGEGIVLSGGKVVFI